MNAFPNIQEVLLTCGATGACHYMAESKTTVPGIQVEVVDTVGCGDAFLAAFVAKKLADCTISNSLEEAVKLSAYIATQRGGCPYFLNN